MNDFEKEALDAQNRYRALHGVKPMTYSATISKLSQKWADHLARQGRLAHSDTAGYGENVGFGAGSGDYDMSGEEVSKMWYDDIKKYDFNNPVWGAGGHFTQMVWKSSTEFGIGKAKTKDGKVFIVANYKPPGNMKGQYESNVFRPSGKVSSVGNDEHKPAVPLKITGPVYCDECKQDCKSFYETKDGRVLCENDYKKQAAKCAACNDPVIGEIISAMEFKWHAKCFVCAECKTPFDGPFYPKDGKPYCKADYERLFLDGETKPERCHGCNEKISSKWVNALGNAWHPECFKCTGCKKPFDGESFFKKDNKAFCSQCV
ncbi:uncharacterized protein [Ptychodera flava]|uniref:uncharacterized protein n=1 Tax=Ptychodera flava TaxID=63121 RepID=UPI00396A2DDA